LGNELKIEPDPFNDRPGALDFQRHRVVFAAPAYEAFIKAAKSRKGL
jgi:hypothetical protein